MTIINMVGGGGSGTQQVSGIFDKGTDSTGNPLVVKATSTNQFTVTSTITTATMIFDRVYARGPNGGTTNYTPSLVVISSDDGTVITTNTMLESTTRSVQNYSICELPAGTYQFEYSTSGYSTNTPSTFPSGNWNGTARIIPSENMMSNIRQQMESVLVDMSLVCDGEVITGSFTITDPIQYKRFYGTDYAGKQITIAFYAVYPVWMKKVE